MSQGLMWTTLIGQSRAAEQQPFAGALNPDTSTLRGDETKNHAPYTGRLATTNRHHAPDDCYEVYQQVETLR